MLEHLPAAGRHGDEQACGDHAVAQRRLDELEEPEREGRESAVEGLEEPVLALFGLPFLEKDRAERRRERQGDEAREHDGQGDRHGKLAVELACDAAEEGDGDEDGGEHEHDGDECARDLLHGLLGRLVGTEALGAHETLDVLKHDDGIVDHDADRERHREERQRVERESEEPEARHRADERHGHCEHRDERGAPVLQEDEDDEEHEDACLEQRVVDLVEGGAHEDRRVVGDDVVDLVFGELGGELDDAGLDGLGGRHGVGARLQVDADVDALRAVDVDAELVGALADFGRGDVLHAHELVGTVSLDDDVGELLGGEELTGRRDRVVELLLGHRGRRAHAARASLRVLGLDGVFDVLDRDAHEAHLFGIEPDAHGGLRVAEDAHVADAGQALEFVDDVEVRVVGQIGGGHAAVGREERDHEEVFLGALSHAHALIAHDVWQSAFGRADAVLALGGGVVGDLAGFAASIYMRGIDFINCPTTTLSMIDSSIGGKTAVDLGETKNIVGSFWQPKLVIVDPSTLATLPRRQYINGLAESVKASLLADPELFAIFEKGDIDEQIGEIIYRSLRFKKSIVEQDETEHGMRKALNFGHTIGHGIEAVKGVKGRRTVGLYHGECVALGMLPMIESKALQKRVRAVYRRLGLPLRTAYNKDKVYAEMLHDKKAQGGQITVIKVPGLGCWRAETIPVEGLRPLLGMED